MRQIDKEIREKRSKQYNKTAREYPAYIFLAILIGLGIVMGVIDYIAERMWFEALAYVVSISAISTALFFLLRLTIRDIAKLYPEKLLFSDRLKPTIRILYSTDTTYTEEQKTDIRKKIKDKKNIDLQRYRDKTYKNQKYVKRVDEAVAWLLDVTRFDDILFEYNYIYGFWQNWTGALLVDALLVLVLAAINKWLYALPLGSILFWIGIGIIVLSLITTLVTYKNGRRYAKKVYDVFMNLDDDKNNY